MMENKEDKIKGFMFNRFDGIFNELTLDVEYDDDYLYGKWLNERNEEIFHRNNWGYLWVIECGTYRKLRSYSVSFKYKLLNLNEFEKLLIEYLNGKYSGQFNGKLIREIGDENHCLDEG